jgi:hypothetical protein
VGTTRIEFLLGTGQIPAFPSVLRERGELFQEVGLALGELVGRGAAIERSLGIPDGAFANRPKAWLHIRLLGRKWNVDHRSAVATIYSASIALWLFGVVAYVLGITIKSLPAWWVNLIAIATAIIVIHLGGR